MKNSKLSRLALLGCTVASAATMTKALADLYGSSCAPAVGGGCVSLGAVCTAWTPISSWTGKCKTFYSSCVCI